MGDIIFGLVSIIIGIAASYALYWLLNFLVSLLPGRISQKFIWFAFLTPATVLVLLVLIAPLFQTVVWSFKSDNAKEWVGTKNYLDLFTDQIDPAKITADQIQVGDDRVLDERFMGILLNNLLWVLVVPAVTVMIGTAAATLSNQVGPTRERIFKSLIFMPMAISFVAASTIWAYFYAYVPPGRPEIGLLNSIVISLGFPAQPWLTMDQGRLNSFLLMAVLVWLQVGYAMVVISAAIKNVPAETIEAAQLDGANAWQIFIAVILPQVWGTVMSVFVTILILVMKIFDIVLAMTRGNFTTSVLAFEWYKQFFENSNIGPASAVVTILVLLIGPLMYLQIRTVRHQETLR
ncbi:MAG TPA: sugar ABC transporter permease [Anaerolineales bacterium]|nr:sugar ABC transporter permease [Anaerolineales bacterium]HNB37267.1 sugar ABC transporter permease [Anaerolineales bacterium]HNC09300.1 sugar ABC transporter permease [Anaerolineales bacterium]